MPQAQNQSITLRPYRPGRAGLEGVELAAGAGRAYVDDPGLLAWVGVGVGVDVRFPIGKDPDDDDYAAVGNTGGVAGKVHSHGLLRDQPGADLRYSNTIDEGTWVTTLFSIEEATHQPPFGVVRFIDRYDNSRNT